MNTDCGLLTLGVLVHHHSGVHAARGDGVAPDRLARARIDRDHATVTRTAVEDLLTVAPSEDGSPERIVFGRKPRAARPDQLAAFLVEGVEAVHRRPIAAPVAGNAPHNHEVIQNGRSARAPIGEREAA